MHEHNFNGPRVEHDFRETTIFMSHTKLHKKRSIAGVTRTRRLTVFLEKFEKELKNKSPQPGRTK